MRKIIGAIIILMMLIILYLTVNIFVPVPLPKWYEKSIKEHVDSSMAHDPFLKLTKETIKFRDERDSLQHVIDSLTSK